MRIPQLNAVGGSAINESFRVRTVKCHNKGWTGRKYEWICTVANLPKSLRLGLTHVSCEGYNYFEDPFVLIGSCGLEYTLEYTGIVILDGIQPNYLYEVSILLLCLMSLFLFYLYSGHCEFPDPNYPNLKRDSSISGPLDKYVVRQRLTDISKQSNSGSFDK
ncbi:MAG: putative store-operated calcium entry-associated regulatory factor isoform X2 [Barrevirus sp.]|uniref:Putative store-operated calcium entry-associated regulatory factor isoform X2 n=1 Tax=Barrevirus sp. TaxID=2487763 RepID=A0A3G4ZSX5_9VIRU|nr:MAG: putative store-operated calcium entry-associated regulatory factor isoform X2 [Barrevirus sp.]